MSSRVSRIGRLLYRGNAPKGFEKNVEWANKPMVKRAPTKISVEGVGFNQGHLTGKQIEDGASGKANEWMYPNRVIQRAPSTKLGLKHYFDHYDPDEKLPRRSHESNFFITLNTNKSHADPKYPDELEIACKAVQTTLDKLSTDEAMCQYIRFGPKNPEIYQNDVFGDVVTKAEWQAAVEVGTKLKRVHSHIWLTLFHYSQLQVNMPIMQKMFKDSYNDEVGRAAAGKPDKLQRLKITKRPYIQVKLLPHSNWAMVMRQYITKAMQQLPTSV